MEEGEKFTINAYARDDSGIQRMEISGLRTCYSDSCSATDIIYSGSRTYTIYAWDRNGNEATREITIYSHPGEHHASTASYLSAVEIREITRRALCNTWTGWEKRILLAILILVIIIAILLLSSLISGRK